VLGGGDNEGGSGTFHSALTALLLVGRGYYVSSVGTVGRCECPESTGDGTVREDFPLNPAFAVSGNMRSTDRTGSNAYRRDCLRR